MAALKSFSLRVGIFFLVSCLFVLPSSANTWVNNGDVNYNLGKVGIGVSDTDYYLQVGDSNKESKMKTVFGNHKISFQGIKGRDNYPYLEMRDENNKRAFYLGWGSKTKKYINWTFENGVTPYINSDSTRISQSWKVDGDTSYYLKDYPTLFVKRNSGSRGASLALGNSYGRYTLYGDKYNFAIKNTNHQDVLKIESDGRVGIGTINPYNDAVFSIGSYNTFNKELGVGKKDGVQLLLTGAYNRGVNTGGKKLMISSYDNDGSTVYPVFVQDENNNVDFFLKNRDLGKREAQAYFAGQVGIGLENPTEKLDIKGNIKLSGSIISDGDICIGNCGNAISAQSIGDTLGEPQEDDFSEINPNESGYDYPEEPVDDELIEENSMPPVEIISSSSGNTKTQTIEIKQVVVPVSTPSPTVSPTSTPEITITPSPSPLAESTPVPTATPNPESTPISTPARTPSPTPAASVSPTPEPSLESTPTPIPSPTATPDISPSPSAATPTITPLLEPLLTPIPSATPSPTATQTPESTATPSPTVESSPSPETE